MNSGTLIKRAKLWFVAFFFWEISDGCNKLVSVPEPISSVTAQQTFSTEANATSAILGIYSQLNVGITFSNLETTLCPGLSADELRDEISGNEARDFFLSNDLSPLNSAGNLVSSYFWQPAYYDIFCANAVISGVQSSTGLSTTGRNQLAGEAKFIRAFCYFYLTNLFGDLPLVLSTDFNQTALLQKTPQANIYQQIIKDLQDGANLMGSDYSLSGGERIRANKWVATALLARVYLYQQNWVSADSAANAVINSGLFDLVGDLDSVFLQNSSETILQLQPSSNAYPYATEEGFFFIPRFSFQQPGSWLTSQLLNSFEANDQRRIHWIDSSYFRGQYYYYPYKYKVEWYGNTEPNGEVTEYYTFLRLSEQFLIKAEAEANLGQLTPALNDLDAIRIRAGLDSLPDSLTQSQVLAAVQQEDRIEFFAEWGHRWLDLKRWGIALQTLDTIPYKIKINSTQLLYPIPLSELQIDPNLTQNPGYQSY